MLICTRWSKWILRRRPGLRWWKTCGARACRRLARRDGFVNVLQLADGSSLGLLNIGEPILGMAVLRGQDGKPRLAVGTRFAVHLFGHDLKEIARRVLPTVAAAFAGPGGKQKDRAFVVDAAGKVTVLILK